MQQLEFSASAGLTLTATLRPAGVFTGGVAANSVAGQAGTNRYLATFSANAAAGVYRLDYQLAGVAIGSEVYELTAADGTFRPVSEIAGDIVVDIDETEIALGVYRRIAGAQVALLETPEAGQVREVINSIDFADAIDFAAAADSTLVFTVRRCAGDALAMLELDSDIGLYTLAGADWPTASDGSVERSSSTRVDVRIAAAALQSVPPAKYTAELRELTAAGDVLGGVEFDLLIRRSAGRRVE